MTRQERTKLVRVLGMLGSSHVGERAAAGLHATRILQGAGATWDALLGQGAAAGPGSVRATPQPERDAALAVCTQQMGVLTAWEQQFVAGIRNRRTLTAKQLATLLKIAGEVPDRGNG